MANQKKEYISKYIEAAKIEAKERDMHIAVLGNIDPVSGSKLYKNVPLSRVEDYRKRNGPNWLIDFVAFARPRFRNVGHYAWVWQFVPHGSSRRSRHKGETLWPKIQMRPQDR